MYCTAQINCGARGRLGRVCDIYGRVCHKLWLTMVEYASSLSSTTNTDTQTDIYMDVFVTNWGSKYHQYTHAYVSNEYKIRMTNSPASSQLLSKYCVCTKAHKWIDANATRRYKRPGLTTTATSDNMRHFIQASTYKLWDEPPTNNLLKIQQFCKFAVGSPTWL